MHKQIQYYVLLLLLILLLCVNIPHKRCILYATCAITKNINNAGQYDMRNLRLANLTHSIKLFSKDNGYLCIANVVPRTHPTIILKLIITNVLNI